MQLGFLGGGNMASAILSCAVGKGVLPANQIWVSDVNAQKVKELEARFSVRGAKDNAQLCRECGVIVLAVKPQYAKQLLEEIGPCLSGKAVVSIMAGVSGQALASLLPKDTRFIRTMPNTPAMVGQGASALCLENTLTQEESGFVKALFDALGTAVWVEERQMHGVVGVSGSGPAYGYLFLEAMADGGVRCGLSREMAMKLAAQTLLGAAAMVLETGTHPGALKDAVCSPGGTTIDAVYALERSGLRAAVIEAVCTAAEKSKKLEEAH